MGWFSNAATNIYNTVTGNGPPSPPPDPNEKSTWEKTKAIAGGIWDSTKDAVKGVASNLADPSFYTGIGGLAWNHPGRTAALATQGIINGVGSVVGLAGTVTVGTITVAAQNGWAAVQNLGIVDPAQKKKYSIEDWNAPAEWVKANTQVRNIPILPDSIKTAFRPIQAQIDGGAPNPYQRQERFILYGPQAIVEVGAFVAVSAVTAGAGGAVWGARTAEVAASLKKAEQYHAATAGATTGATGATAGATTAGTTTAGATTVGAAAPVVGATAPVVGATAPVVGATTTTATAGAAAKVTGYTPAMAHAAKSAEKIAEATAKLDKAKLAAEAARAAGEPGKVIAKAEKAVKDAEKGLAAAQKYERGGPNFMGITLQGSESTGRLANAFNTAESWSFTTGRFMNPLYDGKIGKGLQFVGVPLAGWSSAAADEEETKKNAAAGADVREQTEAALDAQGTQEEQDMAAARARLSGAAPAASAPPATINLQELINQNPAEDEEEEPTGPALPNNPLPPGPQSHLQGQFHNPSGLGASANEPAPTTPHGTFNLVAALQDTPAQAAAGTPAANADSVRQTVGAPKT